MEILKVPLITSPAFTPIPLLASPLKGEESSSGTQQLQVTAALASPLKGGV